MKTLFLTAAISLMLGACSTPLLTPPLEFTPSPEWRAVPASQQSPAVTPMPNVWAYWADADLRSLQAQALARNRDVKQVHLRVKKAELVFKLNQVDTGLRPNLSLNTSENRDLDEGSRSRSVGMSSGLSYEVDLWGRLSADNEAQAAQLKAQHTEVAATEGLIRRQVAESSWTLAALALETPLIEAQLQGAAEILALTRLRVQEGKLLPIEIDKAAIGLQLLQVRQAQLSRNRLQQQLSLEVVLDDNTLVLPRTLQLPAADLPDLPLGSPVDVLSRLPDVQRARWGVDAALAQHRSALAARYPRLSFSANVSTGGSAWRDWLDKPLANLATNLLVPLVDWHKLELQQVQAHNDVEVAALSLRDTLHKAQVEIEHVAAERLALAAEVQGQTSRLLEAQRSERVARLRLEVGSIGKLDWLQVRNARLAIEQEVVQMRLRRALNLANLMKALAL